MALTTTLQYPAGVTKDKMPECVTALAEEFRRTYPPTGGFEVKTSSRHSRDSAGWLILVTRGLSAGFSVLVSAPSDKPKSVTVKVALSPQIVPTFTILGLASGLVIGAVPVITNSDELKGDSLWLGILIALACIPVIGGAMFGVASLVARKAAAAPNNPFPADKLKEIASQAARTMARERKLAAD